MNNTDSSYHYIASISYNGSFYSGFQVQKKQDSVQQQLENIILRLNKKKLEQLYKFKDTEKLRIKELSRIQFAGRTDSKVHALENLISFSCYKRYEASKLINIFNYYLPNSIRVIKCHETAEKINPRFKAIERIYLYIFYRGSLFKPFIQNLVYINYDKIDTQKLQQCLNLFEGTHNFINFTTSLEKRNPKRTINKAKLLEYKDFIFIIISGNSFLHKQIRFMIGTALMYSQGKIELEMVKKILNNEKLDKFQDSISSSIFVVPPEGLYLLRVRLKQDPPFSYESVEELINNLFYLTNFQDMYNFSIEKRN